MSRWRFTGPLAPGARSARRGDGRATGLQPLPNGDPSMSFVSWLRKKLSQQASRARSPRCRARRRPGLEILENRDVLSGGVLDPTFGGGGMVATDVTGQQPNQANAVAVYQNAGTDYGKIVAV